jgi:hypothetical protein
MWYINYKKTTSNSYTFVFPDRSEISQAEKEKFNNLQNMFEKSRKLASEIQTRPAKSSDKNMDSNVSEWEEISNGK